MENNTTANIQPLVINTLICCPQCGEEDIETSILKKYCHACKHDLNRTNNTFIWGKPAKNDFFQRNKILLTKAKNQLNPLSNCLLPFRYISQYQDEKYYQRTLTDLTLAKKIADHYFKDLGLKSEDKILDHGCGRGRFTALFNQLGFYTVGQDIKKHPWWDKIHSAYFQVVPPQYNKLPWRSNTFSAVFNFGVLHYIEEQHLLSTLQEIFRVLKPGGFYVVTEANDMGYAANLPRKQIGRLHSLQTIRTHCQLAEFKELSLSFEGYYSPLFPLLVNFIRKQLCRAEQDGLDFGGYLESITPANRRARWLLKLQKPW